MNLDLLQASDTQTDCPYKGRASYYRLTTGDETVEDVVWYYPDPIRAVAPIGDHLCFFNERVDLEVDGEPQGRPKTRWR